MARRGLRRISRTNNTNNNSKGNNSSLLDNFSFGVFGVNKCESDDQDWYCQLSRIFSGILMIFVLLCIIYYIFNFIKNNFFSNFKKNNVSLNFKKK